MVKSIIGSSATLCLLLAGCTSDTTTESPFEGTGGQQSTTGGGGGLGGMGASDIGSGGVSQAGASIWNADSVEIEVNYFVFGYGGYRWRKSVSQFTAEQMQLVGELKLIESIGDSSPDASSGTLIVTDEDDSPQEYRFAYKDSLGSSEMLVGFAGVTALLDTVNCRSTMGSLDGTVVPDDGCLHGVRSDTAGNSTPFELEVEAGETYQVTVEGCGQRELKLTVLDANDEIVATVSEELGICPTLSFVAPETGPTTLRIEDSTKQVGDFYFSLNTVD